MVLRGFCKNCGHRVIKDASREDHFSPPELVGCNAFDPEWHLSAEQIMIVISRLKADKDLLYAWLGGD